MNSRAARKWLSDGIPCLALLTLAGAGLLVCRAEPDLTGGEHPAPFRVNRLAYDTNGVLRGVREIDAGSVTNLFYGEPLTNVVFHDGFPTLEERWDEDASPLLPSGAPARPARPQYRIDRWDREHGLPANKVNALIQTHDGYLWIGTVGGLARFDGLRFEVFTDANTPQMRTNGLIGRAFFEDVEGRLWIGTERGMLCYADGRFVGFPGQDDVLGRDVRCFAARSPAGFWFGAGEDLGYWDGSAIRWRLKVEAEDESWNRILSLAEGPDGTLWIGTFGCLWKSNAASPDHAPLARIGPHSIPISGLMLDRNENLWIGGGRGVWKLERDASEPVPIGDPDPQPRAIPHSASFFEDRDGTVWATTHYWNGVFRLRDGPHAVEVVRVADNLISTTCILVDREGAVWVGSQDQGLFRLRQQCMTTMVFNLNSALDHIRAVTEAADGSLWFASRAGIGHWSGRELTLLDARALGPRRSAPIMVLPTGQVWAGFPAGGAFELPSSFDNPEVFPRATPLYPDIGDLRAFCWRSDGTLWLGAESGLYRADESPGARRIGGLLDNDVQTLLEDRDGGLWVGTAAGGLHRIHGSGVQVWTTQDGLSDDHVGALHESEDGSLWIGTRTGLCRRKGGRIAALTHGSGVPQQAIHRILEDDFGRLWLGHAGGISRVARRELEAWLADPSCLPAVADLGTLDGLLNTESVGGSNPGGWKGRDGRLWFPGRRGLAVVDPAECPADLPAPLVWIEGAAADGEALPLNVSSRLPPGRGGDFAVRFTATSLHSPERVRIRYRLDPHDSAWRDADSLRMASYAGLRPAHYTFRVQARNHEGRWSEHDAVLAFRLAPHFWQTRLFHLASGLLAAGVAGGFLVWRLRLQRHRLEVERSTSLEQERLRIARDMHDHLGAQLAGIALSPGDNSSAHQRARETLRELNDLVWSVHPGNDTLPSLADFISNFAGRYLGAAGIALDLDLPESIAPLPIRSGLRHEIAGMFKECLRNITQHSGARRVILRMRADRRWLTLTVGDDGRGFDSDAVTGGRASDNGAVPFSAAVTHAGGGATNRAALSGNGLRNFHSRARSLGGSCRIRSTPGAGTEIEFVVPLPGPE